MNQKTTLAIALALVGGVGISIANPWNPKTKSMDPIPVFESQKGKITKKNNHADMETTKSSLHLDAAGIKYIKVKVQLGEVEVSTTSSSNFDAQITKGVSRPVSQKERQWLDNPWLKAKIDGDTLTVYEDRSLKPDLMNGHVTEKEHQNIDCSIKIQIPRGLDTDVSIDAGTETVSGDYQSYTTHVSAGELTLDNIDSGNFLKADVDAGQVNAKLARAPCNDSKIRVAVGEIKLDLKGNANIDARVGIGDIEVAGENQKDKRGLGTKQEVVIGSGGTKLTLDVDAGSIILNGGKTIKRTEDSMEFDFDKGLDKDQDKDIPNADQIRKDVESALKDARIEMKNELQDKDIQGEISKAMMLAQVEIDKAFKDKDIQGEIAKAMKQAHVELGKALNDKDLQSEIRRAMKEAHGDIDQSMKEAIREMEQALKEIDREMKSQSNEDGKYSKIAHDAMEIARKSIKTSMEAMKKALAETRANLKKAEKNRDNVNI